MDESSALKHIFKNEYNEATGTVLFSGTKYTREEAEGDLYSFILKNILSQPVKQEERTREIDAEMVEVYKITEEQFLEWKKKRSVSEKSGSLTGKEMWESRRMEEPSEI